MRTLTNPVSNDLTTGLPTASATLRAMAGRYGTELGDAGAVDTAAAVLAAELWCDALNAGTFDYPMAHGAGAVHVLAALLARAAGEGRTPVGDGRLRGDLNRMRSWEIITSTYPGDMVRAIEATAAHDLMQGEDDRLNQLVRL